MLTNFQKYLSRQSLLKTNISPPRVNLTLTVIIPAYNEPGIIKALSALKQCNPTKNQTEVLVLFNSAQSSPQKIIDNNYCQYQQVKDWASINNQATITFHALLAKNLPDKHAGAGLARKIAMDEAVNRYYQINNPNGIIVSLDADTLVLSNYLVDIEKAFLSNEKLQATTFYFEHRSNKNPEINHAIEIYELYLRYFKQALTYTGFPYAYHTIGSAFAVRASAYVRQGGMNRRQGGEDFYFLHKIFPLGFVKELNYIKVYPSSRPSDRVPFGTGPAVKKILSDGNYACYQPEYFEVLKTFFNQVPQFFNSTEKNNCHFYETLDASLKAFIAKTDFCQKIEEINSNVTTLENFKKRFFQWFNAFQIIKYLNFIHKKTNKIATQKAAKIFLTDYLNIQAPDLVSKILDVYRKLEQ